MPEPTKLRGRKARAAADTERFLRQARAFDLRRLLAEADLRIDAAIRATLPADASPTLLASLAVRDAQAHQRLIPIAKARAFCRRVVAASAPVAGLDVEVR